MRSKWVPRIIVVLIAVVCLAATVLLSDLAVRRHAGGPLIHAAHEEALPVYYPVPDFELTDQRGQTVGLDDLRGSPWIAHFFYSRCTTVCPMVTGQMARIALFLQDNRIDEVRLVSFTVDPQNDTPAKLAEYAKRMDAEPGRWFMLTGRRDAIWGLIERGFKLSVAETDDPVNPISHSAGLVLVDAQGRVRRYYHNMNDPAEADANFAQLASDLRALRSEREAGVDGR